MLDCPSARGWLQCGSASLDENAFLQKRGRRGVGGAWPVAAPMPKSDPFFREKRECLDGSVLAFSFCVPFTVRMAMYL